MIPCEQNYFRVCFWILDEAHSMPYLEYMQEQSLHEVVFFYYAPFTYEEVVLSVERRLRSLWKMQ